MSEPRPWIVRMKDFCAYMHDCGWHERGTFVLFGQVFNIIGMPRLWQARDADNDNREGARHYD